MSEIKKDCDTCWYRDYLPGHPPCSMCLGEHDLTGEFPEWTSAVWEENEIEVKIFDQEEVHYGCTVTIWKNSKTGDQSIGWKPENPGPKCFCCGMPLRWSCDYKYEDFGIDRIACWECDNCGAQHEAWFPEKGGAE